MKKIGIIGAMDCELELIREAMTDTVTETVSGLPFTVGKLGKLDVIVGKSCDGKVNAANCAATMIARYSPDAIVNTGCMGALNPSLDVLDVVIASVAVEHDLDYGTLGHKPGTVFLPNGSTAVEFSADAGLASGLLTAARNRGCNAVVGTIATGDRFVCRPEDRRRIRETFGADGCEMEGGAVAHVCKVAGIPFGITRCVSDSADGASGLSYAEFSKRAAAVSAGILIEFSKLF